MFKKILLVLSFISLTACVTVPESIQVSEGTNLVAYQQVMSDPEKTVGNHARWGGVIANVENKADSTLIEMVHHSLRSSGRPIGADESIGRFRVYVKGFLDPMIYKSGRSVTFVGSVIGTETGMVGEHQYEYPALQASSYHMWNEISQVDVTAISIWSGPRWGGWYSWNHFGGWGMSPFHHRRVTIRSTEHRGSSGRVTTRSTERSSNIRAPRNDSDTHHADRRDMNRLEQKASRETRAQRRD
ncbi:Slp family lipoprotein [Alteromonadaceae bacterium BrNp21-10]|nr:Slp family lipoprotein [Alteromonadaceae bacterium BrNp21-10]